MNYWKRRLIYMVSAIIAAILSFFIPGLGQAINGEVKKGIILFIISIVIGLLLGFIAGMTGIIFISYLGILYSIYAAYDAYVTA